MTHGQRLAVFTAALVAAGGAALAQDTSCPATVPGAHITGLGAIHPDESYALDINDWGEVVGWSSALNPPVMEFHGFRWQAGDGMQDLTALGVPMDFAYQLNDAGQILGWSWAAGPLFWTPESGLVPLPPGAEPAAINDLGHAAGTYMSAGAPRAFWWNRTHFVDLGTLGGSASYAHALNNRGQVVGEALTGTGERRPFTWSPAEGMRELGGGPAVATAINDRGEVAGHTATYPFVAVIWTAGGERFELGHLGVYSGSSRATDINELTQVVGTSSPDGNPDRAFLWTAATGMMDLGTLGGEMCEADAASINNRGQIVGSSRTPHGPDPRAFREAALWHIPLSLQERLAGIEARLTTLQLAGRFNRAQLRVVTNHLRAAARARAGSPSIDAHLRNARRDIERMAQRRALTAGEAAMLVADLSGR